MQLRKFYGRSIPNILARIKRELGRDALILETKQIQPQSAVARLNPGARYEVLAVREPPGPSITADPRATPPEASAPRGSAMSRADRHLLRPDRSFLQDLAQLREQITLLIQQDPSDSAQPESGRLDLSDYYALLDMGVDHRLMAPHLRAWLEWRTAPESLRRYIAQRGGPAAQMQGHGLREWLWLTWAEQLEAHADPRPAARRQGPEVLALLGPSGAGKTTTLAKLASIDRQKAGKNVMILTLDSRRLGAIDQWRRCAQLLDVNVAEILSPADLGRSMENWHHFDWIGIDTPAQISTDLPEGRHYGEILARFKQTESVMVLPATQQEADSRAQLKRATELRVDQLIFTKLDETSRLGNLVNLTLEAPWHLRGLASGPRVPQDWDLADREALWRRVLAPKLTAATVEGAPA